MQNHRGYGNANKLAAGGIQGVDVTVPGDYVDHVVSHYRSGPDLSACSITPMHFARFGVQGIDVVITGANVYQAVNYSRCTTKRYTRLKAPADLARAGIQSVDVVVF